MKFDSTTLVFDLDGTAAMIGDRASDIVAARQNDLQSVGASWGFADYAELSAAAPACIVERVTELAAIVI